MEQIDDLASADEPRPNGPTLYPGETSNNILNGGMGK